MSARILLVTGSRLLVASTHEERAKGLLAAFASSFSPSIVVAGDADGPDDWAATWAIEHACALRVYALDGWVHDGGKPLRPWDSALRETGTRRNPLDRNTAMVRGVTHQAMGGSVVEVLGLEAAWSATKGTAHTLAAARGRGLSITRITFERSEGR